MICAGNFLGPFAILERFDSVENKIKIRSILIKLTVAENFRNVVQSIKSLNTICTA